MKVYDGHNQGQNLYVMISSAYLCYYDKTDDKITFLYMNICIT